MQEKKIICILCPSGCDITVHNEGNQIKLMEGYACKRGENYAYCEFTCPVRILTSIMKVEGSCLPLVPVRSNKPVPKELIFACMKEIRKRSVKAPVYCHDVLIQDIIGTGIDIIATCCVE